MNDAPHIDPEAPAMKSLELRIPPPIVLMIVGALMWIMARGTPHVDMDPSIRQGLSLAIGALGAGFLLSAVLAFRRARTTIDPVNPDAASTIVATGVFGVSRNPMYVGFATLLVAWAIHLAAPWTLLGALGFVLYIQRFQILPEERVLRAKFGPSYEAYLARVRRWL